jgi:hypothetical protein
MLGVRQSAGCKSIGGEQVAKLILDRWFWDGHYMQQYAPRAKCQNREQKGDQGLFSCNPAD